VGLKRAIFPWTKKDINEKSAVSGFKYSQSSRKPPPREFRQVVATQELMKQ